MSCNSDHKKNEAYRTLESGKAIISIKLDGKEFYDQSNVFSGEVLVFKEVLRLNMFDQFKSNFILSFEEHDKYMVKPYRKYIFTDNQMAASVMIGKLMQETTMTDSLNGQGVGYLMTDGIIHVKSFDQEILYIEFKGKGGKFESFNNPSQWVKIEGSVKIKMPVYKWEGVTKEEVFYVQ